MEDVLQQIARTPKLACSSLVLEFLGAKRGHKDVNRLEITQTKKVMNSKQKPKLITVKVSVHRLPIIVNFKPEDPELERKYQVKASNTAF